MFATKKEKFLFASTVVLLSIVIYLTVALSHLMEGYENLNDHIYESLLGDDAYRFRLEYNIIKLLEDDKPEKAQYYMYLLAIDKARGVKLEEVGQDLVDSINEFKESYVGVMIDQCDSGNLEACVQAGSQLETMEKFDAARDAYLKAAEKGHLNAISSLSYLYNNKEWENHSELKSNEWFNKLD